MRILSILFLTLIIFSSCTKESTDSALDLAPTIEGNEQPVDEPIFNPIPSPNSTEIREKIKLFGDRISAVRKGETGAKDGELSIDDATWSVEALLNVSYANAAVGIKKIHKSEHLFSIAAENGAISNEDLLLAFETSRVKLESDYNAITVDNKMPILIDLKEVSINSNSVDYKLINLIAITKPVQEQYSGSVCGPNPEQIFDPVTDWWHPLQVQNEPGQCCEPEEGIGESAYDQLERELNTRYELPFNFGVFVDIEWELNIEPVYEGDDGSTLENPNWDGIDPCRSHLMWTKDSNTNQCDCLSPELLDWYYCNIASCIDLHRPENKEFASITMDFSVFIGKTFHIGELRYGTWLTCDECIPCPPNVPDCPCVTSC